MFGSTYHLKVNSYLQESEQGKLIKLGDTIKIMDPVKLG